MNKDERAERGIKRKQEIIDFLHKTIQEAKDKKMTCVMGVFCQETAGFSTEMIGGIVPITGLVSIMNQDIAGYNLERRAQEMPL